MFFLSLKSVVYVQFVELPLLFSRFIRCFIILFLFVGILLIFIQGLCMVCRTYILEEGSTIYIEMWCFYMKNFLLHNVRPNVVCVFAILTCFISLDSIYKPEPLKRWKIYLLFHHLISFSFSTAERKPLPKFSSWYHRSISSVTFFILYVTWKIF